MDHKSAVAGQMLRHLAEGRESDKRYRVTVEFAHGVRHVLEVGPGLADDLHIWAIGGDKDELTEIRLHDDSVCSFKHDGRTYVFNRDYLCSMTAEEVKEP